MYILCLGRALRKSPRLPSQSKADVRSRPCHRLIIPAAFSAFLLAIYLVTSLSYEDKRFVSELASNHAQNYKVNPTMASIDHVERSQAQTHTVFKKPIVYTAEKQARIDNTRETILKMKQAALLRRQYQHQPPFDDYAKMTSSAHGGEPSYVNPGNFTHPSCLVVYHIPKTVRVSRRVVAPSPSLTVLSSYTLIHSVRLLLLLFN
jgi:hypothetical protein